MKRISIAALGACLIALPAGAQTGSGATASGAMGGSATGTGAMGSGNIAAENAPVELDASQFAPPSARVNGRVTDLSQTTGAVRLQSSTAPFRLHFPTQALSGVSENAPVIVHIAYSFSEAPAGQEEAAGSTGTTGSAAAPGQGANANAPAQLGAAGVSGGLPPGPVANVADEYSLKGTFSKIDQNYGLVTFTPEPMMLTVYLPREALQGVKPGDPVSAEVALLKSPGARATRAGDAPSGQPKAMPRHGAHWMKATVSEVDPARGVFVAQADKFTLQLPIPAAISDQIAPNKSIAVNLSFEPDVCSGSPAPT